MWAWCAVTAILCASSGGVAASGAATHAGLVAGARALVAGVPMAVGLYAWRGRPYQRFGPLLLAAGVMWSVTGLAESDDALLYSIGRSAGWVAEVLLVYAILSFPTGHLPKTGDRLIVWALGAVVVVLYLPTLMLDRGFPLPSPFTSCQTGCPSNAFFALHTEPGFVDAVVVPLRELLTIGLFAAATIRLSRRLGTATQLMQRAVAPVLGVAIARLWVLAIAIGVRRFAPGFPALDVAVWLVALAVPAIALGFLAGLLRQRLFVADAVRRLALRLREAAPTQKACEARSPRHSRTQRCSSPSRCANCRRRVHATGGPVRLPGAGRGPVCDRSVRGRPRRRGDRA